MMTETELEAIAQCATAGAFSTKATVVIRELLAEVVMRRRQALNLIDELATEKRKRASLQESFDRVSAAAMRSCAWACGRCAVCLGAKGMV